MRLSLPRFSKSQTNLTSLYERAAESWQRGMSSLGFDAAYAGLAGQVAGPPRRMIDVGCGTGALAGAMIKAAGAPATLDLLDASRAMLDQAARHVPGDAHLWEGLLGDARVPQGVYSHVLCAHVIEHLDDPDPAFDWLHSLLEPGGTLVLAMSRPHWCTALIRWRWGNRAYRPEAVRAMLAKAGFTDIRTHPFSAGPPARVSCGYTARRG